MNLCVADSDGFTSGSADIFFCFSISDVKESDLFSSAFNSIHYLAGYYICTTMSRRPNTSRRFTDSGSIPFMGALHHKSRPSPLLSIGLVVVVHTGFFF